MCRESDVATWKAKYSIKACAGLEKMHHEFVKSSRVLRRLHKMEKTNSWRENLASSSTAGSRIRQIAFSVADQGLSVGGMFLVNIALARTQTKEAYGVFALSYTAFTFLSGLHNAAVLETFTIYGSGRYGQKFREYARLLWCVNAALSLALTVLLLLVWAGLEWRVPRLASRPFLGLALACGILLSASFVRRTFFMQRRPELAAGYSLVYFVSCTLLLWFSTRAGILDGFYAFGIVAFAWVIASLVFVAE